MGRPHVIDTLINAQGVDTLDGLLDFAVRFAKLDQDVRGQARFVWFLSEGKTLWLLETPWENDPEKWGSFAYVRTLLDAHRNITHYANVMEMWASSYTASEKSRGQPRDDPQRYSALLVFAYSRAGEMKNAGYKVRYGAGGTPRRIPLLLKDAGSFTGLALDLFKPVEASP